MDPIEELAEYLRDAAPGPSLESMPRLSLADKGILGPTGAHRIEELHVPPNLAFVTFSTGTTAFQNIVGVTSHELEDRITASARALELSGVLPGDKILFTYPPLVNVFPRRALDEYRLDRHFLEVSCRDALLLALCRDRPRVVVGESSFLRATLEDAVRMGMDRLLPRKSVFLAAGTPLDPELAPLAAELMDAAVHDLYGCQEFGWLTLDGIPLRSDIALLPPGEDGLCDLAVGGLPTGDRFPVTEAGHCLNPAGSILTYAGRRGSELETTLLATTAGSRETAERLARTVLRIKSKIVRISPDLELDSPHTVVRLAKYGENGGTVVGGPEKTALLDSLLRAQLDYQRLRKNDPAWNKER